MARGAGPLNVPTANELIEDIVALANQASFGFFNQNYNGPEPTTLTPGKVQRSKESVKLTRFAPFINPAFDGDVDETFV